jgi:hypothetical protein
MKQILRSRISPPVAAIVIYLTLAATLAYAQGVVTKSGASSDLLTIDTTSKAARTTLYDSSGRELSSQSKLTYMASSTFTPAATPSDLIKITGSATKTIRVISLYLATTNTAAGSQQYFLIKRSADDTTGTFVAATAVPLDSNNGVATATVGHYTANPGGLGATVGTIRTVRWASPAPVPATFAGVVQDAGFDFFTNQGNSRLDQTVTLRGAAQILAVNFNGVALVAGQTHAYHVEWIEE